MHYPAKTDWWVAVILLAVSVYLIGGGLFVSVLLLVIGGPLNSPAILLAILGFLTQSGVGVLLLWAYFTAGYAITPADLLVRLGPLRWRIPLDAIVEVVPLQGYSLDWGWGLALSLDRIRIKFRKKNGKIGLPIYISPTNKGGFLLQIAESRPDLQVFADGSMRFPDGEVLRQ